jgi:single-strand DNA-binding protein
MTRSGSNSTIKQVYKELKMQQINLIGRITKDAELKYTSSGKAVANFNLAVDDGYGDNKTTLWIRCALWGERAEKLAEYLTKGKPVYVTGRLAHDAGSPRTWTNQDGDCKASYEVTVNELVFTPTAKQTGAAEDFAAEVGGKVTQQDDEVPF